jgi:O-antigen/teichoic acid export membrane protein
MARRVVDFNAFAIFGWDRERFSHLLRFGGGVFGNSLLSILIAPLNKIVLSRYVGVQSLPVYEIAVNGAGMVRSMADAPLRAIMPEISRIWSARSADAATRVHQIYRRSFGTILRLGLPMYAALFLFDKPLLRLWLRHRYTDSLPTVLNILLLGTMISMLTIPAYYALMGAGRIRTCFVAHVIATAINVLWLIGVVSLANVSLSAVAWGSVAFFTAAGVFLALKVHGMLRHMLEIRAAAPPPQAAGLAADAAAV